MVTREENELLTRVGPGTPMGELMRRYWIPAAMSTELAPDAAPTRLMLLGEQLLAFRDSSGRVGILDHACPHRCASLFFGRNEEGGLRCIYHGWKFDVEGNCLEMANVPPHQDFKSKIKAKAYKAVERNGLIWTYMGQGEPPELPQIEATLLAEGTATYNWMQRECNWLQVLEGDLDTSHTDFLHGGDVAPKSLSRPTIRGASRAINRSPEYEISEDRLGHDVRCLPSRRSGGDLLAHRAISCFRSGRSRRAARLAVTFMAARLGADGRHAHHVRCASSAMPAASNPAVARGNTASSPASKTCCRIP